MPLPAAPRRDPGDRPTRVGEIPALPAAPPCALRAGNIITDAANAAQLRPSTVYWRASTALADELSDAIRSACAMTPFSSKPAAVVMGIVACALIALVGRVAYL